MPKGARLDTSVMQLHNVVYVYTKDFRKEHNDFPAKACGQKFYGKIHMGYSNESTGLTVTRHIL